MGSPTELPHIPDALPRAPKYLSERADSPPPLLNVLLGALATRFEPLFVESERAATWYEVVIGEFGAIGRKQSIVAAKTE
jgi:hypothetical protein